MVAVCMASPPELAGSAQKLIVAVSMLIVTVSALQPAAMLKVVKNHCGGMSKRIYEKSKGQSFFVITKKSSECLCAHYS